MMLFSETSYPGNFLPPDNFLLFIMACLIIIGNKHNTAKSASPTEKINSEKSGEASNSSSFMFK